MPLYADPRPMRQRIRKPVQLEQDGVKATFALVPDSPCLAKNVEEKLSKLEVSDRQVNHLSYKPLRHLPLACLVETSARTVSSHRVEEWGVEIGYHMAALAKRLHWYMRCKNREKEEWVDSPELFEGDPPDFLVRFGIHFRAMTGFFTLSATKSVICK